MPTISLTKNEAEFMDYLLLKFMDSDGEMDENAYTQWSDAEKMRKKIAKALLPKSKMQKSPEIIIDIECEPCSRCHFFDNGCLKERELKNYWGFDDDEFEQYLDCHISGSAEECIQFQHKKVFRILSHKNNLYDVEITEDGKSERILYSIESLRLFAHKYGKCSFVNYKEYKTELEG